MFEIGFWEILLIAVMTLLVVGPEKLPAAARAAGTWFGKARRFIEGVKTDVEQEFDVSELKRLLHNQEVQINELTQKIANPDLLDEELESTASSVYSIDDESTDVDENDTAEISKKDLDKKSLETDE